jgi:hypothetical protein
VRGRLVAVPRRNPQVVGSASVSWDGMDTNGQPVASGTTSIAPWPPARRRPVVS